MTLAAGARLGPYEILSPLGAGGMGEVYKARDTRLERTVAVKVLPSHMSASPEVRQRFEREAKTISQLSHPHICALYDVGREGETEYLVMEYLEGETLTDRLAKGPLPLEQTLRYGVEIADALDKAHRQGIVHRDLKPGNVMLTKTGVKLLDFGLAKAMAPASQKSSLTSLPTQQGLTQEGTILGTFQYMAPEQLEGKDADARTDIFAFGAVLYEMATGKKAFSAGSQASLITAIMSSEPAPISSVQPMSPLALDRVVKTCLAKDPEDRWQSAADAGRQLKWLGEASQTGAGQPVPAVARRGRRAVAWGALALGLLVGAGLAAFAPAARHRRGGTRGSVSSSPRARPHGRREAPDRVDLQRRRPEDRAGRPRHRVRRSEGRHHRASVPKPRDGRVAAHPRNRRSPGPLLLAGRTLGRILAGTGTSAGRALGRDTSRCRRQGGVARRDLGPGRVDLFRERALWRHQPRLPGRRRRHGGHGARQGRRREEPPVARDSAGGQGAGLRGSDGPVVGRGADRSQAARHRRAPCPHPRRDQPLSTPRRGISSMGGPSRCSPCPSTSSASR